MYKWHCTIPQQPACKTVVEEYVAAVPQNFSCYAVIGFVCQIKQGG